MLAHQYYSIKKKLDFLKSDVHKRMLQLQTYVFIWNIER